MLRTKGGVHALAALDKLVVPTVATTIHSRLVGR